MSRSIDVVRPTDQWFACAATPDQGTASCVCSRCGAKIPSGFRMLVVRNNNPQPALGMPAAGEYRFCRTCNPDDPGPGTVKGKS